MEDQAAANEPGLRDRPEHWGTQSHPRPWPGLHRSGTQVGKLACIVVLCDFNDFLTSSVLGWIFMGFEWD